jgi:CHAT domain-containing protein/uncharacterized protein HemY
MNVHQKAKADQLIEQGIERYETDKLEAAIQSWQQALNIYRAINHRQGEAEALANLGLVYDEMKNYPQVIEYYQQYLDIARELGDYEGEQIALDSLGNAHYCLRENIKALEFYQLSLTIAKKLENLREEGITLNKLGLTCIAMRNYDKAIVYYQQSLTIAIKIQDRQNELWILDNLGEAYSSLNNYAQAIEYYQMSLSIARELQDHQEEGWVLENLGDAYYSSVNYIKAIESYEQWLALAQLTQNDFEPNKVQDQRLAWILCKLGMVYKSLGDTSKASELYQQSLALAQALQNLELEAQVLGKLGDACLNMGLYNQAINYQEQCLQITQQLTNSQLLALALAQLGEGYYFQGDYAKAIDFSLQSLGIAQKISESFAQRLCYENLGNVYNELGDYTKAIGYYHQSLAIAREQKNHELEAGTINNLGCALIRSASWQEAEKILRQGIKIWDDIRTKLGTHDNYKVSIFDIQAKTYRHLQQVLIAQNKTDQALEFAEEGRTRALVELVTARFSTQISPNYPSIEQIKNIAKAQNATLIEYSVIYHSLEGQEQPKSRNTELLIWVIQPTGNITFRLVDITFLKQQNTPLGKFVDFTRESIGVRGRDAVIVNSDEDKSINNQKLRQLHEILIEPIVDLLPKDPDSHVIFIPTGPLFLVPFPALRDASEQYLIEKHTILTAPSIQVLAITQKLSASLKEQRQKRNVNLPENALVVGNPVMPKIPLKINQPSQLNNPQITNAAEIVCRSCSSGSYGTSLVLQNSLQSLRPLPGAEKEAKEIALLLNTQPIIGDKATKVAIVEKMSKARIIHLAAHGLLDDFENLGIPGAIALAPSEKDNGLLTAGEIRELQLNAELVVLSACDTGKGRLTGDGVIGLSRSLISAGVPSIVVSLWGVPDASTALLMTEFYRNFYERKLDKAQALRFAMLATMQQHPNNPKAWAAFTLIGQS